MLKQMLRDQHKLGADTQTLVTMLEVVGARNMCMMAHGRLGCRCQQGSKAEKWEACETMIGQYRGLCNDLGFPNMEAAVVHALGLSRSRRKL